MTTSFGSTDKQEINFKTKPRFRILPPPPPSHFCQRTSVETSEVLLTIVYSVKYSKIRKRYDTPVAPNYSDPSKVPSKDLRNGRERVHVRLYSSIDRESKLLARRTKILRYLTADARARARSNREERLETREREQVSAQR